MLCAGATRYAAEKSFAESYGLLINTGGGYESWLCAWESC